MKKLLNILLVFSMVLSLFVITSEKVYAAESLSFVNDYEKVGQEIKVDTSALTGDLKYTWYVDGKAVSDAATYIPTAEDENKFIEVVVSAGDVNYSAKTFLSNLPVVYIDIENGATVTSKDYYLNSEFVLQGNDQYNKETTKLYSGAAEIKGRGNSTWGLPKKPYRIKLDKGTDFFGYGKSKHWVLLANYYDTTFLRNKIGYDLAGDMGIPYMQSVLVDLVMNGQYVGNYQLCEHVRIDDERIEVTDWEGIGEDAASAIVEANNLGDDALDELEATMAENFSWIDSDSIKYNGVTYKVSDYIEYPDVSGGYLLEMDTNYDEVSKFRTNDYVPIMFKGPEFANTSKSMMNYVKDYINAFEESVKSSNYTAVHEGETKHYSELFDMQSLVDNWLVQELFFNEDFMKKSTYMYKNHDELFKMGPVWDLDWASGADQSAAKAYDKWQTTYFNADCQGDQWYKYMAKDPYFIKLAQDRYLEIRESFIEEMMADIESYSKEIAKSAQASLDIWRKGKNYESEMTKFKNWMNNRLDFLDAKIADFDTFLDEFDESSSLIEVSGLLSENETTYHYAAEKGTQLTLTSKGSGSKAEVWVNNQKVDEIEVEDGKVSYNLNVEEDSVVQFYFYNEAELVSKAYTSISTKTVSRVLTGIEITQNPIKTVYKVGEELDVTGLTVKATYDDGTYKYITDYSLSGYDSSKEGTKTISVNYGDFDATFEVEVIIPQAEIYLETTEVELNVGETYEIIPTLVGAQLSDLRWESEDNKVAEVYAGKVVAVGAGETMVHAYLPDGQYVSCKVKVVKSASDLTDVLDPSMMNVSAGNEDHRDPATNVLDGIEKTVWHTDWNPTDSDRSDHYLTFVLDEPAQITGIKILNRDDSRNGVIQVFDLYVKETSTSEWVKVLENAELGKEKEWHLVEFDKVVASEIKLQVIEADSDTNRTFSSAAEIRFVGAFMSAVNKTSLTVAYEAYANVNKDEYVQDEAYTAFNNALTYAKEVLDNLFATQEDVDGALVVLNQAYNALNKRIFIEGIELDQNELVLQKADIIELKVKYNPEDTTETTKLAWTSSDESVVKVFEGTVVAVGYGEAVITVTTEEGLSATCNVVVEKPVDPEPPVRVKNGWEKVDEKWYFYVEDVAQTGWVKDGAKWYFMDESGVMQTGWIKDNNKWYYLNSHMMTGWQQIDGLWYYLNAHMITGWLNDGGQWYFLDSAMKTGWVEDNGKWYYLDSAMKTGWQFIDGKWWYLNSHMMTGWQQINGTWYYLNNSMVTGWLKINNIWYYFNEKGAMVTGTQVIDGETYQFNSNGAWLG